MSCFSFIYFLHVNCFVPFKMSLVIRLFDVMILTFKPRQTPLLSVLHSFPGSISKLSFNCDQQWNDCLALLIFYFFVTSLSTAVVMETVVCVCVFQSIPKAEQFITHTKPIGKCVLCCVCALLPLFFTHPSIFTHISTLPPVMGPLISTYPTSAPLWDGLSWRPQPQPSTPPRRHPHHTLAL